MFLVMELPLRSFYFIFFGPDILPSLCSSLDTGDCVLHSVLMVEILNEDKKNYHIRYTTKCFD